ncbi:hypothetical protein SLEP1_g58341 [Rubroshorea leprosula]|uniref:Uncharacterized protein n=1 Tax=Rubroshorea leprosula TaxID=152421 RepID=A0AAV5MPE6_9ROSI|nr:hypothetical protein SLEP1_g58341 [Rubroshorea leprosula]
MLEPACASSSDDLSRGSLVFQIWPPPIWIPVMASWRFRTILSRVN